MQKLDHIDGAAAMPSTAIDRIEADIRQLSLGEQLWLLERLAQHIRERALPARSDLEAD